jgi:hypothetical protein
MMQTTNRLATKNYFACLAATMAAFAANVAWFYPGVMNFDSRQQYDQAVSGIFTDWHPPVMAWLWSYLRLIADNSGPLFVLHIFFYWTGFGIIAATLGILKHTRAGWWVLALGLFPPLFGANADILKDVGMAVVFLAAFALAFAWRARAKPLPAGIGLIIAVLLVYGTLVRANSVFALPPLLIYAYFPKWIVKRFRLAVAAAVIIVLAIGGSGAVNRYLIRAEATHPLRALQIFDLVGIAYYSDDVSMLWPGTHYTIERIRECYSPLEWDVMGRFGKCSEFWNSSTPEQGRTWALAILKHPMAYLEARMAYYNSNLYFLVPRHHTSKAAIEHVIAGTPIEPHRLTTLEWIEDWLLTTSNPLFTPAFALVLAVMILSLSLRTRLKNQPLALAAHVLALSATAYSLGYLFVGVASLARYHYWTLIAAYTAAALWITHQPSDASLRHRRGQICFKILALAFVIILLAHWIRGDALAT